MVSEEELRHTVEGINEIFRRAEEIKSWDVCLSVFHCFSGFMFSCCCGSNRYKMVGVLVCMCILYVYGICDLRVIDLGYG